MAEEEILDGNKLIAEFMGCKERDLFFCGEPCKRWGFNDTHITDWWVEACFDSATPYHNSWDWLMPVVEKIGKYKFEDFEYAFMRTFHSNMARINRFPVHEGETQIEATFKAVVEFVKWHNENLKPSK